MKKKKGLKMATKRITITLDERIIKEVKERASNENRTVSNFVTVAVKKYLSNK